MKLVISEIFHNIQGEGIWQGTPSFFLRTAGCSIKCPSCDTIYSWAKERAEGLSKSAYFEIDTDDIVMQIVETHLKYIVFTGGEPVEQIEPLVEIMKHDLLKNRIFTIETSGNIDFDPTPFHMISISPKMAGMMGRKLPHTRYLHLPKLIETAFLKRRMVQLKYVIATLEDLHEAQSLTMDIVPEKYRGMITVIFQPNNLNFSAESNPINGITSYLENLKNMTSQFMAGVKNAGFYQFFPHTRVLMQNHWLLYGRHRGT